MHNQEGYPGLNQYGEPSETLCQLDAALRRATDGVYGVRDLGQRGDGSLVVTVIEVEQALRGDVRNTGTYNVTVPRPQDFGARTPADRAAYIVEALFDSFIRKERELHVWLGAEKFRELRRGLRHNWMLKHGLSDAPQSSPYFTTIEFWFGAYSQSADGMKKAIARQFGDGGRFEKLRSRINGLILFGDPSRQPGPVKGQSAGYSPPGWGIARYLAPKWLEAISYSITTNGDMYACTADDTLLPGFYRWFIEAETSLSFVEFSAGIVIPAIASYLGIVGPLLGGLFGGAGAAIISGATGVGLPFLTQMLNSGAVEDPYITKLRNDLSAKGLLTIGGITKLFKTLAALPGIDTHGRYWEPRPEFGGRTGIQVGCEIMAGFRR
jgi:hypothetical protein